MIKAIQECLECPHAKPVNVNMDRHITLPDVVRKILLNFKDVGVLGWRHNDPLCRPTERHRLVGGQEIIVFKGRGYIVLLIGFRQN